MSIREDLVNGELTALMSALSELKKNWEGDDPSSYWREVEKVLIEYDQLIGAVSNE